MHSELCLESTLATDTGRVKALSKTHPLLDEAIYLSTIDSTNMEARRRRNQYAGKNVLFIADEQTAGLGQQGRSWDSAKGLGLWASLLIQNAKLMQNPLDLVSLYTGVIVHDVLDALGVKGTLLKWPNDIIHDEKKLGGILTEINWMGNRPGSIIIGMGLNVLHREIDFPQDLRRSASSVSLATGSKDLEPIRMAEKILISLLDDWDQLSDPVGLSERWNQAAWALNEPVRVQIEDREKEGLFLGVDQKGRAVISMAGHEQHFSVGSLRLTKSF